MTHSKFVNLLTIAKTQRCDARNFSQSDDGIAWTRAGVHDFQWSIIVFFALLRMLLDKVEFHSEYLVNGAKITNVEKQFLYYEVSKSIHWLLFEIDLEIPALCIIEVIEVPNIFRSKVHISSVFNIIRLLLKIWRLYQMSFTYCSHPLLYAYHDAWEYLIWRGPNDKCSVKPCWHWYTW